MDALKTGSLAGLFIIDSHFDENIRAAMNFRQALQLPRVIPYQFHFEGVLGTSASLRFDCTDAMMAESASNVAIERIVWLESIFSSYRIDSTLMRWQGTQTLPNVLCHVLDVAEDWRRKTGGAFAPGVTHANPCWEKISAQCYRRMTDTPFTLNGIAKGAIVDNVAAHIEATYRDIKQIVVNIGGDLCVRGAKPVRAGVQSSDDSASPLTVIGLCNQAIATSGTARRGFHLVDPRNGQPVTHAPLVSVVAPTAMLADVLSTACSILTVPESLALVASTQDTEIRVVDAAGNVFKSSGWKRLEHQAKFACRE